MCGLDKFKKNAKESNVKYIIISLVIILTIVASFFWYTSYAYYKQVNSNDVIKAKVADFRHSKYTSYDNTNTGLDCTGDNATVQCAIDELSEMLGD